MKLFPFVTLKSKGVYPTLLDIAKRTVPFALIVAIGVSLLKAFPRFEESYAYFVYNKWRFLGCTIGWMLLFLGLSHLSKKSGYIPFVFICPERVSRDEFFTRVESMLRESGFKVETAPCDDGGIWIRQGRFQWAQIIATKHFPLRAYLYRNGIGESGSAHFVLQVKAVTIWDTGETSYLSEIGTAIISRCGLLENNSENPTVSAI
jgi:hypothetical protein